MKKTAKKVKKTTNEEYFQKLANTPVIAILHIENGLVTEAIIKTPGGKAGKTSNDKETI